MNRSKKEKLMFVTEELKYKMKKWKDRREEDMKEIEKLIKEHYRELIVKEGQKT